VERRLPEVGAEAAVGRFVHELGRPLEEGSHDFLDDFVRVVQAQPQTLREAADERLVDLVELVPCHLAHGAVRLEPDEDRARCGRGPVHEV
jgi:hypothetical protein